MADGKAGGMNALRILLVSEDIPHPKLGGLGKHAIALGNALIAAGHQVDLLGNNYWPYEQQAGDVAFHGRFFPALNVKHAHWKERQLGFFNYYRRAFLARRFAKAILEVADRYDVIHYHGHLPILANNIPEHINFVQTRHDQGSDCLTHTRFRNGDVCRETDPRACAGCATARPNGLQRTLSGASVSRWRAAVKQAFQRHKVVFVSQFLRDNADRTLANFSGDRVHVVHHFIDAATLEKALADSSPAGAVPDIFIAARIDHTKGVGAFLEAFRKSHTTGRHVTVAGDGPDLAALRQQFNNHSVTFLGWTHYVDVIRLTERARLVVVPSVWEEAFGGTTLEALSLGRPVLALNRGATPELKAYELYPDQMRVFGDMESLVAALAEQLAQNPSIPTIPSCIGDVGKRLPEILTIYTENFVAGK